MLYTIRWTYEDGNVGTAYAEKKYHAQDIARSLIQCKTLNRNITHVQSVRIYKAETEIAIYYKAKATDASQLSHSDLTKFPLPH